MRITAVAPVMPAGDCTREVYRAYAKLGRKLRRLGVVEAPGQLAPVVAKTRFAGEVRRGERVYVEPIFI